MKKRYQIALVVIGCLVVLIGLSYAYFTATNTGGGKGGDVTVKTYTIDNVGFSIEGILEFNDLDIYPGHKNISKIKVTAIGDNDIINYKLVWEGINTLNTPLRYYVYKTTTNESASITCKKEIEQVGASKHYFETCEENITNLGEIISEGEITKAESSTEFILKNDEVIKGTQEGNVIYYYVVLEYPNLEESQNIDMGGKFEGLVTVKKETTSLADITIKKMYQETANGYEEINKMPEKGYIVSTEKSTCTNNATPTFKGSKILITNITASNTECNIYFEKDKEKPTISNITSTVAEKEINVTVEANDNLEIAEYWYAIGDNEFVKGTGNTYQFTGLTPNTTYEVKVYVKDTAGNESETFITSITTAPDTTKPIISDVATNVTRTEINVTVTASDDTEVTEYWFQIDNNTPVRSTTNTYKFTGLGIGSTHTISVYAKDAAGNQSDTTTKTVTTTPDTVKPTISDVTSTVTMTEINVTVTASDDVGVTEYWYAIDSGSYTKGTGNTYKFTNLGVNSTHTVSVYVKDAAGNTSDVSANIFITAPDSAKPTISNVTTSATETEISVTVSASDNVGVTEYWYAIDSGSFTKGTGKTHKFTGLKASSTHTVKVYVKDKAGNQSTTTTKSVTTPDTTKPTISNVTTSVTKTEITVNVTASDNVGVTEYWYKIDSNAVVKGTGKTHKFTGLAAGSTHSIKVYVKDKAGNQSTTTTKSVTTSAPTSEDTLDKLGITNVNENEPTTFASGATTDEGVFKTADPVYGGYTYYWRGKVTNNYVKFAGKCWRIVRINGDGSMRIIYDGATCHANGTSTSESIAVAEQAYNSNYNQSNYVGWTYTGTSQRTLAGTASNAKTQLESWYNGAITGTNATKVADGKYCNDRNAQSGNTWAINGGTFYYAAFKRIYEDSKPSLVCNTGDVYTLKVGLITVDEVMYAGGSINSNSSYYLYNGQNYWTMSPREWYSGYANVFFVHTDGNFGAGGVSITYGLRPVINLKADTVFAIGGNGTQSNPYAVS